MLYPKKNEVRLSEALFQNPTCEYRGAPFWSWNCTLEEKELLWQLEMLKKMGMGGAHMHVRTGLTTRYLSDEHMGYVKTCVEKCRKEKMLAWLYDEDRWPSGAAGGYVTADVRFRAKYLLFTVTPYSGEKPELSNVQNGNMIRSENGTLLTCYDIVLDKNGCLAEAKAIGADEPARGTKWYVYVETPTSSPWFNYQTYVNTLSKEAMARFIEITYQRYLQTVGDDFGGVVPAIFSDEPEHPFFHNLGFAQGCEDITIPWTDDIAESYLAAYDEELLAVLPQVLWQLPDGQVSTARYRFHDHVTERFVNAFADQCGAWCREHGLLLTGHMMDEYTLAGQSKAIGEAMRSYRSFGLPGIDMLHNRVELTTAKQCQSAVRQYGAEGMLSELYGVTGWNFDFRGHKFQGDWQAALGVTVRVPHLTWLSMKGESKRDFPACIGYQSPWWQDYSVVEDHFARIATALTRGTPMVRIGVIHPIESYWLHCGPEEQTAQQRSRMEEQFQNLTDWLLKGSLDFDFICESLLPELCPQGGTPLQVGQMAYDVIIVPSCETLRNTTLDRLEAFQASGGTLIFLGDAPKYADARPSDRGAALWNTAVRTEFRRDAVLKALEAVRTLEIRDSSGNLTNNLVHQLRRDGDSLWLFIAHAVMPEKRDLPAPQTLRITLNGSYQVRLYDTMSGQIRDISCAAENGKTIVQTVLHDLDSLLLSYTPGTPAALPAEELPTTGIQLPVPAVVPYRLEEPNVLLMDKAEYALDDAPYQPETELLRADEALRLSLGWHKRTGSLAQPWVIPDEPITHRARMRFTVHATQSFPNVHLALEDADVAEISLNGQAVLAKPDGWYVDKAIGTVPLGELPQGDSHIDVVIPFGKRIGMEWCYLLGNFGVQVCGEYRELIPAQAFLGYDDITRQGLAHYGSNVTYQIPVETTGGKLRVTVPHYVGTAIRATLDGQQGYIICAPYQLIFENVHPGKHTLELTLLGHRHNSFGPLHRADTTLLGTGPVGWRTQDAAWTDSYRFRPIGILSPPIVEQL